MSYTNLVIMYRLIKVYLAKLYLFTLTSLVC